MGRFLLTSLSEEGIKLLNGVDTTIFRGSGWNEYSLAVIALECFD
jgi:hypothetical protein